MSSMSTESELSAVAQRWGRVSIWALHALAFGASVWALAHFDGADRYTVSVYLGSMLVMACAIGRRPGKVAIAASIVGLSVFVVQAWLAARNIHAGACRNDGLCETQLLYGPFYIGGATGVFVLVQRRWPWARR